MTHVDLLSLLKPEDRFVLADSPHEALGAGIDAFEENRDVHLPADIRALLQAVSEFRVKDRLYERHQRVGRDPRLPPWVAVVDLVWDSDLLKLSWLDEPLWDRLLHGWDAEECTKHGCDWFDKLVPLFGTEQNSLLCLDLGFDPQRPPVLQMWTHSYGVHGNDYPTFVADDLAELIRFPVAVMDYDEDPRIGQPASGAPPQRYNDWVSWIESSFEPVRSLPSITRRHLG